MYTLEEAIPALFPQFEASLKAELIEQGQLKTFEEGETMMRTGQYFKSALLITEGLVKLFREGDEGNEFFIYHLGPGQACALSMVCTLRGEASEVMARAAHPTTVIIIPQPLIGKWMMQYHSWYEFVLSSYRQRFEELLQTVDQVIFKAMDERLEFYLRQHQQILQSQHIPFSHQQVADELNSSREVISRLLKKMEQLGKVKLHRHSIEIIRLSDQG